MKVVPRRYRNSGYKLSDDARYGSNEAGPVKSRQAIARMTASTARQSLAARCAGPSTIAPVRRTTAARVCRPQGKITKNFLGSMSYCESDVDFSDKAISIHRHAWG